MSPNDNPTDMELFLCYFRWKIKSGVRQIDIANSEWVNRSSSYVNKIFLKDPKNIPIDFQESIASYFGITLPDLIEEGRVIHNSIHQNPLNVDGNSSRRDRVTTLEDMIYSALLEARKQADRFDLVLENQSYISRLIDNCGSAFCVYDKSFSVVYQNEPHRNIFGRSGFLLHAEDNAKSRDDFWHKVLNRPFTRFERYGKKTYRITHSAVAGLKGTTEIIETIVDVTSINEELEEIKKKIELMSVACSTQEKSYAIFDEERRLVFVNGNLGILDNLEIDLQRVKVEELVFALRSKIADFNLVEQFLDQISTKEKSEPMAVEFKDGTLLEFEVLPLWRNDQYQGVLVTAVKLQEDS